MGVYSNIFVVICLIVSVNLSSGLYSDDTDFDGYEYMNLSADPCEDFYEYTCGNFKNLYPLKDNEMLIDEFSILEDSLTDIVQEILSSQELIEDPFSLKKAKAAYTACMQENFMDNQYMKSPEIEIVKKYGGFPIVEESTDGTVEGTLFGWNDIADIAAEFGVNIFFSVSSYYDSFNASATVLMITSDSTTVPKQFRPKHQESYDEAIEESFYDFATKSTKLKSGNLAATDDAFELFLKKLVTKINRDLGTWKSDEYITEQVSLISSFMHGIYSGGYVPDGVNPGSLEGTVTLETLNNWTVEQFGNTIQIDWVEYIKRVFKYTYAEIDKNTPVIVTGSFTKTLYGILNWVNMTDSKIVKSTALLKVFVYMASDSDKETRTDFETYLEDTGKTVYPRWQYCSRKLMDITETLSLSLAVVYEYQLRYFNKTKFDVARDLIEDLQTTFKEVINETDWMDETSKEAALRKVHNIITLLGYPRFTSNSFLLDQFYENLPICKWDHYGNSKILRAFKQAYVLNMFSKRDRAAWDKSPFITNAYYNRQNNKIIFPVAMLNSIFFSGSISLLDYSRIGMIVAHEITHGFDNVGYLYNEDCLIQPWWTTQTQINFKNKTLCFVDQYSKYIVPELNATMDSSNSLNENLADNGGTRTALKALKKETGQNEELRNSVQIRAVYYGSDVFIGFGTMWCNNESLEYTESTGNKLAILAAVVIKSKDPC
ncbi:neprilysin-11-like [Sitophilus oryzae]|uniref:Neprilysin-11-like n=1 Tax=Sitophilus oryzae TaxID=7048 RepID=A0A6J2Y9Q0_SITOR|nr:neprilysin-11-like [Sitophilus oryzae]